MSFRTKITLNFLGYDLFVYSVVGNPVFIHFLGAHILYSRDVENRPGYRSSMLAADDMKSRNGLRVS